MQSILDVYLLKYTMNAIQFHNDLKIIQFRENHYSDLMPQFSSVTLFLST